MKPETQHKRWLMNREQFDKACADLTEKHKRSVAVAESGGHLIYCYVGESKLWPWRYVDTNELYDNKNPRPCAECGRERQHDQPDPCLGWLPGVKFACCGHGFEGFGYIVHEDGTRKIYNGKA